MHMYKIHADASDKWCMLVCFATFPTAAKNIFLRILFCSISLTHVFGWRHTYIHTCVHICMHTTFFLLCIVVGMYYAHLWFLGLLLLLLLLLRRLLACFGICAEHNFFMVVFSIAVLSQKFTRQTQLYVRRIVPSLLLSLRFSRDVLTRRR